MNLSISALLVCLVSAGLSAQTLRGSPASVDLMYTSANEKDLAFLHTRSDIYQAARAGDLSLISINNDLTLDRVKFPFVLPYTLRFADSLAAAYRAACGQRLVVTSGSRPLEEQPRNASPKSVHPTGMAIDFRKPGGACLEWLRGSLLGLESRGLIEATEERFPPHFHVAVLQEAPMTPQLIASGVPPSKTPRNMGSANGDVSRARDAAVNNIVPTTASGASSRTYRVRAGDNLWTIARRHSTTSKQIEAINGLTSSRLRVGQVLKLP